MPREGVRGCHVGVRGCHVGVRGRHVEVWEGATWRCGRAPRGRERAPRGGVGGRHEAAYSLARVLVNRWDMRTQQDDVVSYCSRVLYGPIVPEYYGPIVPEYYMFLLLAHSHVSTRLAWRTVSVRARATACAPAPAGRQDYQPLCICGAKSE